MTLFGLFFDAEGYLKWFNLRNFKIQRSVFLRSTAGSWNFSKRPTLTVAGDEKSDFFRMLKN